MKSSRILDYSVARVPELLAVYFPELQDVAITVVAGSSRESLFRTRVSVPTLGRPPLQRRYFIIVSTAFASLPADNATDAILVHELQHIADYCEMSGGEFVGFVFRYVCRPHTFVPAYERQTDRSALARQQLGHLDLFGGMSEFREYLYRVLPDGLVAKKKRNYLTPDEITALQADATV